MGSQPWKTGFLDHLVDVCSGARIKVERPNGDVIEGIYVGDGQVSGRPHMIVNEAPPDVRPPSPELSGEELRADWERVGKGQWWDFDKDVPLERDMKITVPDGTVYITGPSWRRQAQRSSNAAAR